MWEPSRGERSGYELFYLTVRYKGYLDGINGFLMMLVIMIMLLVLVGFFRGAGFLSCLAHVPRALAYSGQIRPRGTRSI